MAKIKFNASKDDESVGGGGGAQFTAAPRGIYTLQIADHSDGQVTQGGNNPGTPITKFVCEIADDGANFGKKVWHNVVWIPAGKKGHGMAVHFLHAVGMPYDGPFEFDECEFQGRTFRALLEVETYNSVKDGHTYVNEKNVVREVYTDTHPEPAKLPPPPAAKAATGNPAARMAAGEPARQPSRLPDLEEIPF